MTRLGATKSRQSSRCTLEDRTDLMKARKALKEKGSASWKKIKADLGRPRPRFR